MSKNSKRVFLRAYWAHVAIVTYDVPKSLLEPRLPPDCVLDTRDGLAFVSLVAFDFKRTRVRGIPWPDFPEINLRFYVRHGDDRGVVFIRELVPSHLVSFVARALYNEPYYATKVESHVETSPGRVSADRRWRWGGKEHQVRIVAANRERMPDPSSTEHFFKEH